MAFLVSEPIALTPTTTAAANYPITLSTLGLTLVDDDWLILSVFCSATSGTLAKSAGSTGWTEIAELDVSGGQRMARYKCKVASGTAADPTIELSTGTGQWRGCIEQWRDADATDCVDSSAASAGTSGTSEATGALTPGTNNCAISYFSTGRRSGAFSAMRFKSDEVVGRLLQAADDGSIFTTIALGTVQQTTAAATAKTVYADRTSTVIGTITVAIKNKTSGGLSADCRAGVEKMAWMGSFGERHESLGTTWGAPSTFVAWTGGTIGGITADTNAPTINNDTSGAGFEWGAFSSISSATNTAGALAGGWIALPSTIDLTGKFISLEWFLTLISAQHGTEGVFLALGDNAAASTGNAVVFKLAPKAAIFRNILNTSVIDPATATTFDTEGSINLATINKVGFFYHRVGSSATARTIQVRNLLAIANSIMVGGCASKPLDVRFLDPALNGWGFTGLCGRQGDAVLVKTPVQFGDGTFPTYFDSTATLLNTPAAYNLGSQPFWNAAENSITVGVKGASGDTLNFVASALVAGPGAEQNFTVDAATSASANVSLQGGVFGNWLWTGDTDFDPTGATYSGCDEVAWVGALVTNCTVTNTTSTDAAASVDANTSIIGTTIDGTGALYALELGASVSAVTLTNCTLTAGSTDKVHVLDSNGAHTVTITISGTTSLVAGDVTTAGATVVIAAPNPTLSATVLSGSRVVLYNDTTAAELDNTAPAGTSWSKVITSGASSGDTLTLHVFKEGYEEFSTSFIYAGIDNALLVSQSVHAAIASLRTELSITDYTTITEFALDITGTVEIDADDADGNTMKARLAIWYNGVLTTENGARYLRGAISILSTAAIRINVSVLDLLVANVSVTYGLNFTDTDRRLYRSDGTAIYAAASAPGSIQNDYSGVPDTVTTSDQSLNLATAEQAIDNKLSSISSGVWAYVVTGSTTAVQMMRGFAAMLLGRVSGAGTTTEVFRDIDNTKDVVTVTVDSSGNRSAVTRDLT